MDKSKYLQPRQYEMMVILLPDQAEEDTTAMIDKMLGYITDEQGTIDSVHTDSPWGRRRLAYTIRHEGVDYRDGHYVLVYFTVLASAIGEIERELKLDTNVIRYLLLQYDEQMGEKIDENDLESDDTGDESEDGASEDGAEAEETQEEADKSDDEGDGSDGPADEAETADSEEPANETEDEVDEEA